MSTIWDFSVSGASVLKVLRDADPPREQSFTALSMRMVNNFIYLYERGIESSGIAFEQIGEIDGVEPTDLQDAYDKILALIVSIFDPANYDLDEFANASANPFLRQDDITPLAFTDLTDVPSSYAGQAGKFPKVNPTEDGLIFGTGIAITPNIQEVLEQTNKVYTESDSGYDYELSAFADEGGTKVWRTYMSSGSFFALNEFNSDGVFSNVIHNGDLTVNETLDIANVIKGWIAYVDSSFGRNELRIPDRTSGSGYAKFEVQNNLPAGTYDLAIDTKVISSNYTAVNGEPLKTTASLTITDIPSPNTGDSYTVLVIAGTTTIDSIDYTAGSYFLRWYDGSVWNNINLVGGSSIDLNAPYVTITDLGGTIFTDLATAHSWIGTYTDNTLLTNEVFSNGVYRFTCQIGSDFSLADGFLGSDNGEQTLKLEDNFGLITLFGNNCFIDNNQKNTFCLYADLSGSITFGNLAFNGANNDNILNGNCLFGNGAFANAVPTIANTIKYLGSCGTYFANECSGQFNIYRFGAGLPSDLFSTTQTILIVTDYYNRFSNSGDINNVVVNAMINLKAGNINSFVSFDGVHITIENSTTVVLTTSDLDTTYPYAMPNTKIVCAGIIGGGVIYERQLTQWTATLITTP